MTVKNGLLIIKRDWRRPEDYESLKKYSLVNWAWEFLRRNPEYCQEYRKLKEGRDEIHTRIGAYFPGHQKWNLLIWLDPDHEFSSTVKADPDPFPFIKPGGTEEAIFYSNDPKRKSIVIQWAGKETGEVLFRFDTRLPINPQIEAAKKELLALQRKQSGKRQAIFKPRKSEWITLLRVLDATAEGYRPKAIAEAFYPDEKITSTGGKHGDQIKEISDKIKQAKRYISHDYRLIPFLTK